MNVVTSAPQLDTVEALIPGLPSVPGKQALPPVGTSFPFLSLLNWLTENVLPPTRKAEAPSQKKDKPDTRDPQVALAIELLSVALPVKPPLVLDTATPTAGAATAFPAQTQPDPPLIAAPSPVAFAVTLTDRNTEHTQASSITPVAAPSPVALAVAPSDPATGSSIPPMAAVKSSPGFKEVPPEPTKDSIRVEAPVINVAPVEIGSNTPQTATNSIPIHSEPPKVELKTEINTPIRPQPTREISLKLAGTESGSVDVRISERAGKVQVDVRTPDGELARALRADLADLVGRLDKRGFDAEASIPQNHLALAIRSPERPENNSDSGSKQSQGGGSPQSQGERRGGRPKSGRGRGFSEVVTERNEENHVNSN